MRCTRTRVMLSTVVTMQLVTSCVPQSPDMYVTDHMVAVVSDGRTIDRLTVEDWTREAYALWLHLMPTWRPCIHSMIRHGIRNAVTVRRDCPVYCDEGKGQIEAYAYTQRDLSIVIGGCGRDKEVYIHELSHVIVWVCGGMWKESHNFFRDIGFPYTSEDLRHD